MLMEVWRCSASNMEPCTLIKEGVDSARDMDRIEHDRTKTKLHLTPMCGGQRVFFSSSLFSGEDTFAGGLPEQVDVHI